MKRFSITIASILFFLVSVSGVHGASFEISGGTESNVTTDTAQTITGAKTFGDNVKLYWGDGQDANCVFDGTDFLCSGPSASTAQFGKSANEVLLGDASTGLAPQLQLRLDAVYKFNTTGTSDALLRLGTNDGTEVFVFDDSGGTVGLVIDPTNELIAGTTASGGDLAMVGSTHNTKGDVVIHSTSYLRFDKTNAGAPSAGDCDDDGDRGRLVIDTTNDLFYVCNGGVRFWDSIILNDGTTVTGQEAHASTVVESVLAAQIGSENASKDQTLQVDGDGGVSWQDSDVKVGNFTRDTSLASGDQTITGVGFKPAGVIFFMSQTSSDEISWGMDDGTTGLSIAELGSAPGTYSPLANAIFDNEASGTDYKGDVKSFDNDGFTIAWIKISSPTGTIQVQYIAFR
ncbi:hypothetical protein LCGC14_0928220 [marine sediment metagenome]|uniref:Uncharacterized protein n=1 Tax=marine sediment metagenome TaxID=412755 RepID=A0A0F9R788_9ZZZZ